ncbi:hypothetical protein [Thermomonospora cellulosilytica]|uniref:Uncharacterized protein n=1 Tax=Thermomonospora cellulosilytica TaxID=1411118 RepID=A0A7W3N0Z2_9ACTN|nr:hypothetical protein [Thermomonospora cellulosilytica]MBA9005546.1 hypothetical protein [Thermomonospora cellulosilytica]
MTYERGPASGSALARVRPLWAALAVVGAAALVGLEWLVSWLTRDEGEPTTTFVLGLAAVLLAAAWLVLLPGPAGRIGVSVPLVFAVLRAFDGIGDGDAAVRVICVLEVVACIAAAVLVWLSQSRPRA